jgi:recombination protein RecA
LVAMNSKSAALRLQVESSLAARATFPGASSCRAGIINPFQYRERPLVETVPTGVPPIDSLTGGLPRGCLTEIYGPACSGRTSLLISVLASRTAASEVCALVDARDAFDPHSAEAAGVKLQQLLWVRCRNVDQALRATDLLVQGGGFGMIALDLADIPPRTVRYVPLQVWFRFRRAVENTRTIFLVLEQESNAKTCASLVLNLQAREARWSRASASAQQMASPHSPGCLLDGWTIHADVIRSHSKPKHELRSERVKCFSDSISRGIDFETAISGRYLRNLCSKCASEGGLRQR